MSHRFVGWGITQSSERGPAVRTLSSGLICCLHQPHWKLPRGQTRSEWAYGAPPPPTAPVSLQVEESAQVSPASRPWTEHLKCRGSLRGNSSHCRSPHLTSVSTIFWRETQRLHGDRALRRSEEEKPARFPNEPSDGEFTSRCFSSNDEDAGLSSASQLLSLLLHMLVRQLSITAQTLSDHR